MGRNNMHLFVLYFTAFTLHHAKSDSNSDVYIVHVEPPPDGIHGLSDVENAERWYRSFLPTSTLSSGDDDSSSKLIYSYHHVITGFAARLTAEEVKEIAKVPGFISAKRETIAHLDTTRSPSFLGLNHNAGGAWAKTNYGAGVIIAILDGGITPTHPSFSDDGVPRPPARWKGRCELPSGCNNKVIGARFFAGTSPVDETGHGTFCASTAAGNFVTGANLFGSANGTASGIAPRAHLAIYRTCDSSFCQESSFLAGVDAAIQDGVDIISMSISNPYGAQDNFFTDSYLIAAFRATERGIFVSSSAGNSGPNYGTVGNGAPWMLTVGASTIDRRLAVDIILGNSTVIRGESTLQPKGYISQSLPIAYPIQYNNIYCDEYDNTTDVRGKIVICEDGEIDQESKAQNVKNAGGVGVIVYNRQKRAYTIIISSIQKLPSPQISYADGLKITEYIMSAPKPTARFSFRGTLIGEQGAPVVTTYSGRGSNSPSRGIHKPDIIGPGNNILAAWHHSIEPNQKTNANFDFSSGTSMSCPHLAGAAALIKSIHPDWSPAAIQSALMTTADTLNNAGKPILNGYNLAPASAFDMGAGHVNIQKALDPGLIYDIDPNDYIPYLCGLNYTDKEVQIIVKRRVNCSLVPRMREADLNYPSLTVIILSKQPHIYNRTVTNVGNANEVYTVQVSTFPSVTVSIEPSTLRFTNKNQRVTYRITVTRYPNFGGGDLEGSITWKSSQHSVRTLLVIHVDG